MIARISCVALGLALLLTSLAHAAPEACARNLADCVFALEALAVDNSSFSAGLILQGATGDATARSVKAAIER